ncbi:metallophosphoesterase family protein [Fusicatenibacter sp.]
MIYITGDCHRDFRRFNTWIFPEQKEMTKDDFVIICGDFGGIWSEGGEDSEERYLLKWLQDKPFTTLFVDGNHENFDRLYEEYPVKEWHGGNVHEIRPSVLHLMRGQVFEFCGKTFFTFGGASSHDVSGGILDRSDPNYQEKKKKLDRGWKPYRINHLSWWQEELASEEEMEEGRKNLAVHDNCVDFIVTHCCASSVQDAIGEGLFQKDRETEYFEEILQTVQFRKWFFGHYHDNRNVSEKLLLLYEQIIRIV